MYTRLTKEEKDKLVLDNLGLVKYCANLLMKQRRIAEDEFEDLVSIGTIGLIKATETFDILRNTKFGTYASKCIKNEIRMHLRKEKCHRNTTSLDDYLNGEDNQRTLGDSILEKSRCVEETLMDKEIVSNAINIILNALERIERLTLLYRIGGVEQETVAQALNYSRSNISRIEKRARKKLNQYMKMCKEYRAVFSMTVQDDNYQIRFSTEDVKNFNEIFTTLLQKLTVDSSLPDFKIKSSKGKVIIQVPADLESFTTIAKIMQEIDEF